MSQRPASDADVLVVGGGIAGLAAAYDLQQRGVRLVLCEATSRVGGLIRTERRDGFVIEAGPDAMLAQKPAALALCRELGLADDLVPTREPRTAYVLRDGVLHPIPADSVLGLPGSPESAAGFAMLSPSGRARLAAEFVSPPPPSPPGTDQSIGSLFRRRFGDESVHYIAQPLLGGIHAGDVERLSLRALFPLLAEADAQPGSLLAARAARRGVPDPDGAFRGLRCGMSTLVERLEHRLGPETIVRNSAARQVLGASPFTVETTAGPVRARAVVMAAPAWQASRLLDPLDLDLAHDCASIPYASTATASLAYARPDIGHPLSGTGFVVPRGERATRLLAVSWVTSKWPGRAPDGVVLIRAFAGGTLDSDLVGLDDRVLTDLVHQELAPLLDLRRRPVTSHVVRWMDAGAQYEVGHGARVAAVERGESRHPGLFFTGSGYRGVGIPDCVADARRVATRVAAWLAI